MVLSGASRYRTAVQRLTGLWTALLVCAAYYAGSQLGLLLRIPPTTPSVLWPPNAILAAALLLTPSRRWVLVLLAALPAHLAVELQTEWPLSLILTLFLTNSFEAVIAAGGVRLLSKTPRSFDTFSALLAFFTAAVVAAPLLSSFADAGAVRWLHGEAYWEVFRNRLLSNMLAELTIVPAIVGALSRRSAASRPKLSGRTVEALLLAGGLLFMGTTELNASVEPTSALHAVSSQNPLVLQLPFLLWAAARFGPTGTALALLVTTVLSAWDVVHGHGVFASASPRTSVVAMTLSLVVVATAFLFLSTLIEERRHSQQALASRLRFEELLGKLASAFAHLPSDRMERAFDDWLPRVGAFLKLDGIGLVIATEIEESLAPSHCWTKQAGIPSGPVAASAFPWAVRRLLNGESVIIANRNDTSGTDTDRTSLQALGLRTGLAVPLTDGRGLLGVLAAGSVDDIAAPEDLAASLALIADVFAPVLERKRTEDALRRSELMKSAILSSLTTGVVLLSPEGDILDRNETWAAAARDLGVDDVAPGANLMAQLSAAAWRGNAPAADVAAAIAGVIDRARGQSTLEYVSGDGDGQRWWSLLVVPLHHSQAGAVVTQREITALRRAELDAQRSREELAHVARVSTIGELTASLAHELNQPLAAIKTNAQAAQRILRAPVPDLHEVKIILGDIVEDDTRASAVIQRLRELLRRGQVEVATIDLVAAVREVTALLRMESIVHNVAISVGFEREPIWVHADRVQIEQVVLNLLQNAIDAATEQRSRPPVVSLTCQRVDSLAVVRVSDSGNGLPAGGEERVFEPFFSTKREGMGMGLSIARTIVEAYGGRIRAKNGSTGAVFEFSLPIAVEAV